jgi:hypothetical protein
MRPEQFNRQEPARWAETIGLIRDRMVSPSWPTAALYDALTYEARIAREAGRD